MRRPSWKVIGLAGLAGVAATGAVVARRRRNAQEYDPDELRSRLHQRLGEVQRDEADAPGPASGPGGA